MKISFIIAVWAAAVSLAGVVSAQEKQNPEPKRKVIAGQPVEKPVPDQSATEPKVEAATAAQLGTIMSHLLDTVYVTPEVGTRLARQLQEKIAAGAYADAATPSQLADKLTADLRAWSNDKHLFVRHNAQAEGAEGILTIQEWDTEKKQSAFQPGGGGGPTPIVAVPGGGVAPPQSGSPFEAKKLSDGIGYLRVGLFAAPDARAKIAEAMRALEGSTAYIVDVRDCPGGSADAVSFLASYFFDAEPRVLMNRYFRPTGQRVQSTTVADIPGKRVPDADLYILTSPRTASAGESFAFTLQQYGRAKVVGETTAGAGYNNGIIPLGKGFIFSVSIGRPEHPRSGKGWEVVGVQPDVKVAATEAFEAAQKLAAQPSSVRADASARAAK